jgi:hypothetical protein
MQVGGQRHASAALLPERDPLSATAGWDPGQVWTGAENLAPIGIRSTDRAARSQSLYRLRYPGPVNLQCLTLHDSSKMAGGYYRRDNLDCHDKNVKPIRIGQSSLHSLVSFTDYYDLSCKNNNEL